MGLAECLGHDVMLWGIQNLEVSVLYSPLLSQVHQLSFEFCLVFFCRKEMGMMENTLLQASLSKG